MARLKSPLNLFILLGLICQGKTWDGDQVLVLYTLLWFVFVILNFKKRIINDTAEFIILLLSLITAYYFLGDNLFEKCLALGNALAVLQFIRLTYKLDYRRKILAFAIASTQIIIGTQIFLDYSFLVVLILALVLIPKSLFEINILNKENNFTGEIKYKFKQHKTEYLMIFIIAVLFFIFFPRVSFEPNSRFYSGIGIDENSIYLTKPNLQTSLASVSEKDLSNNEIIFQVLADDLKYFKTFSLDKYDGDLWSISPYGYMRNKFFRKRVDLSGAEYRKVDIKYKVFKSRFLPVDGEVLYIEGNFFDDPVLTRIGNVVIPENIQRKNKSYEYWVNNKNNIRNLTYKERKRFTQIQGSSKRLSKWLNGIIKNKKTDLEKAEAVCLYLKQNFKYELGAPKLDKKLPIEDFIFKDKKGHCERFASALAVILRKIMIPSTVAVGYLVQERNVMGGYYNIRALDAHAWVEAYFKDKGWVIFDPTPPNGFRRAAIEKEKKSEIEKYLDYIEYIWYSKIVNMSYGDQISILGYIGSLMKYAGVMISKVFIYMISIIFLFFILFIFFFLFKSYKVRLFFYRLKFKRKIVKIEHFYDSMLQILLIQNIVKPKSMTPYEFLSIIKTGKITDYEDYEYITEVFYKMKYGLRTISDKEMKKIEVILKKLNSMYK